MNSVKQRISILLVVSLLAILPILLPLGTVSAQTGSYSIDRVDHQIQVMYSGHLVVLETIHVSGRVTDGFMIGLPYQYSAYVLKALAFDDVHLYDINLGVDFGNSGFYGAEVDFNGNSPSVFTVAFILSNRLITQQVSGAGTLEFPAYPSLTQNVGTVNVNVTFPSSPTLLSISKEDGQINAANYVKTNLPAYTYSIATASFQVPVGSLQSTTISSLNRQITIDPSGKVSVSDSYRIISNSSITMQSYVLNLPIDATDVVIRDDVGRTLSTLLGSAANGNMLLANATLVTFLLEGQSTTITAQYNLPSATLEGAHYVLADFPLFPECFYYVNQATIVFTPPEGATIVTPELASLDSSSTLTRESYQDTLTVTKEGISFLDYLAPKENTLRFSFDYNPVWASLRPTFWASLAAVVGFIAVFFVRRRRPQEEETVVIRSERLPIMRPEAAAATEQPNVAPVKTGHHVTPEEIREFIDTYEDKKRLTAELKSLDQRAQKGKIPRRQYKVQKRAVEIHLEGVARHIQRIEATFLGSSGTYADLVRQLDAAEADLSEAEENIKSLDFKQSRGEISLETYKRNIGDYQKRRDKAESVINGILLRLREKLR